MIPDWCKAAAEEIWDQCISLKDGRTLVVSVEMAAIIAKHAPVIGIDLSRDAKDYSMMVEGYHDKDGLHITNTQRVFTEAQVRELVEAARELVENDLLYEDSIVCSPDETERMTHLRRALEPFK